VSLQQFFATLISECELTVICPSLKQISENLVVQLLLRLVHFHLQAAEVVQQRKSILFINDPIQVGSVLDQQVSY
jgi:hypothetical protein